MGLRVSVLFENAGFIEEEMPQVLILRRDLIFGKGMEVSFFSPGDETEIGRATPLGLVTQPL
ncbi:hypothetical protein D3C80_225290 [compost metagenome]